MKIEKNEYKLTYADNILMYQWQPADSLPKLMQSLEQFGKLSGYK